MKCEDCGADTLEAIWIDQKIKQVRIYCTNCHILDTIKLSPAFYDYTNSEDQSEYN